LRISVDAGGCSGFQYHFKLDSAKTVNEAEGDVRVEREGMTVVVDNVSLELIRGAKIDFEEDLMRSGFVLSDNPNAATSCGCGSSFMTKP